MTRLPIGAVLLPLVLLAGGHAQAGLIAERCGQDGGTADSCRCVEREVVAAAGNRFGPIAQAVVDGRTAEARILVQQLTPAERTDLNAVFPRAVPDVNARCATNWQPRPLNG